MKTLILATNNQGKLAEIRSILPEFTVQSMREAGLNSGADETGSTFEENAKLKAEYVYNKLGVSALSDDSGLLADALDGSPGIFSARFAGEHATDQDNVNLLLEKLKNQTNRNAKFVCVLCLVHEGKHRYFKGEITGTIAYKPSGTTGFGYDPVFIPNGYDRTFAEMLPEEKNSISHRKKALEELKKYLSGK